jgi:hypothetical protein
VLPAILFRMTSNEEPRLIHSVYFTLSDQSNEALESFLESANEHLNGHDGCIFFGVGLRAEAHQREVNDTEFDVALTLVFDSRASHDKYQMAPRHLKFIDTQWPNWSKVRVFDSLA